MSRYIDADKLVEYEEHAWDWDTVNGIETATALRQVISDIRHAPTADMVEVVRCKDCKWQDKGKNECESWNMCRHNVIEYFAIYDEHFCEWGERREDG